MRPTPRTRFLVASVAAATMLSLAACGDDDDDDTVSTETTAASAVTDGSAETEDSAATTDTSGGVDTTSGSGSETTAGSGEGDVGSQEEYVDLAREEFAEEFDDDDIAACVGEALVNDDVYAAIQEAGLTLEAFEEDGPTGLGLDEAQASLLATDLTACGDLLPELFSDEELACAEDSLTNDQVAEVLAFTLVGATPSEELQAAFDEVDACVEGTTATT